MGLLTYPTLLKMWVDLLFWFRTESGKQQEENSEFNLMKKKQLRCPVIKIFNRPIKMLHTFKGVSRVPNSGTLRPRKLRYLGGRKYRNLWKRKFKLPSISLHKNDNWWGMSTKKIDCNLRKRNLWGSNLRGSIMYFLK